MKILRKIVDNRLKWEILRQDFGEKICCYSGKFICLPNLT
jgi:hypothetical protein